MKDMKAKRTAAFYAEYMHALSAGPRVFWAAGDYFIDTLRASHGLYINKNLYGNMYGAPDGIYNLVLERKWTLDQFYEIVNGSYIDANGNGEGDGRIPSAAPSPQKTTSTPSGPSITVRMQVSRKWERTVFPSCPKVRSNA